VTSAEGVLLAIICFVLVDALIFTLVLWGLGRQERFQPRHDEE
jgi:hypothetical protein